MERATADDLVMFMSDHGFQSCTGAVHMDRLLEHFGFLEFSASRAIFGPMQWGPMRAAARKVYDRLGLHGKVPLPQSVNWSKTKAYTSVRSTGEGISVNLAGRESDGIVDPADFEKVRDGLAEDDSSSSHRGMLALTPVRIAEAFRRPKRAVDIARIESGDFSLSVEPVSVLPLIREACQLMEPLAAQRGITIRHEQEDPDLKREHEAEQWAPALRSRRG